MAMKRRATTATAHVGGGPSLVLCDSRDKGHSSDNMMLRPLWFVLGPQEWPPHKQHSPATVEDLQFV